MNMMKTTTIPKSVENMTLRAADGYRLASTRYNAEGELIGHLIVAGATAVPQSFYRHFAEYASNRGFTTLTLDYRGVGQSKPASLKEFEMDYLAWAYLDLAAAVEEMADDTVPLFLVGHSFGGHAFGLLPNHQSVRAFYTFATGAGWHGWMPFMESLKVRLLWNVILPVVTRWKGYLPGKALGLGEDLPLGVYKKWRHWCRFPKYFFDDPDMAYVAEAFARIKTPVIAANALDDLWALPQSRDAFIQAYRNAPVERIDLDPDRIPGGIGHMGYFRPKSQTLWDGVLEWFQQQIASREPLEACRAC